MKSIYKKLAIAEAILIGWNTIVIIWDFIISTHIDVIKLPRILWSLPPVGLNWIIPIAIAIFLIKKPLDILDQGLKELHDMAQHITAANSEANREDNGKASG